MTSLRKISQIREDIRKLNELELNKPQIRELIEENYPCFANPAILKEEIEYCIVKGLRANDAYNNITKNIRMYKNEKIRIVI